MSNIFALKGTIVYTPDVDHFVFRENCYLVCKNKKVEGIYSELPDEFKDVYVYDYGSNLIVPGMCDMHMHAPQYGFRGLGQNIENSDWSSWFSRYAFPDESRYADLEYAKKAYERLANDLLHTTTTRFVAFSSLHRKATELLMQIMAEKGFAAYIGKVNMDRNSMEGLIESTEESLNETKLWLENTVGRYDLVKPIITPRYVPSCTDEVMEVL